MNNAKNQRFLACQNKHSCLNKRGQFYLLTSMIIIVLVFGIVLVTNYSKTNSNSKVDDLSEQLKVESSSVLDYGATHDNYRWMEFTKNFSDYSGGDVEIIYIIGNASNSIIDKIDVFKYNELGLKEDLSASVSSSGNQSFINLGFGTYTFIFREGENFYFIMSQNINGEKYVATN